MQSEIQLHLKDEEEMEELIELMGKETNRVDVMERIMQYVPCIMHAKNRIGIKILDTLLIEGLSNDQGGFLEGNADETIGAREKSYIKDIKAVLNRDILGSEGNLAQ